MLAQCSEVRYLIKAQEPYILPLVDQYNPLT